MIGEFNMAQQLTTPDVLTLEEGVNYLRHSRTVLLHQAGMLADDESLTGLRDAIYAERGRPEAER
jgi:hypothetical protein